MQSGKIAKTGELDITVSSDISELEKTLLEVKSLRYQMYTKYLSEKLEHEKKLRQLENQNNFKVICGKSRKPLMEMSLNGTGQMSEKGSQTCSFHSESVYSSKTSLGDSNRNPLDSDRETKNYYDERLFHVVEQLEYLARSSSEL